MKHIAKSLVVIGSMLAAGSASADWFQEVSPVIGVDYYHAWMKGKGDYHQIFPKSYPGFTVYVGTKIHEYFGLELGFDSSGRKKKDWTLPANTTFAGSSATTGATGLAGQTKIRRQGGHLDLIGYIPLVECLELTGSIGYGWVKPQISTVVTAQSATGSTLATALNSLHGKGKSILRLGIGLSWMVTDMVGLRAKFGWESTSHLRVEGNQTFINQAMSTKAFKSSTTATAGVFVKF